MVKCVIFDLDDTLCNYKDAKENAKLKVNIVLEDASIDVPLFWQKYHEIEPVLFRQFTEKKITKDTYRLKRYADVLEEVDEQRVDLASQLNFIYMNEANNKIQLFDDVIPFLQQLKKQNIEASVLTNGPSDGQQDKVRALGLTSYIEKIFISEEIGFSKPSIKSFQYVLNELQLSAADVVMVGDSIEYDINGSNQAGIKGLLLDRANKYVHYEGTRINNLRELIDKDGRITWL